MSSSFRYDQRGFCIAALQKLLSLLCAAAGWSALAVAQPLLPGVGVSGSAADPRHQVVGTQAPWRALCRVQTEFGARCTGVVVGPARVMTAAHCLWLRGPQRFLRPSSVHVLWQYEAGHWAAHAVVATITIGPGYDFAHEAQTAGADWAVLTLARPIAGEGDILPFSPAVPAPGTKVVLGGYEQDRAEALLADTDCRVLAPWRDAVGHVLFQHDCAGTHGSSGAPLLTQDAAGHWQIAGIQVVALPGRKGGYAVRP
jgi:protease YdgD